MNRLDFHCTFDLADTITALLGDINDDYPVISVYGKYDVIKELLEDLIMNGVSIANEVELQDYEVAHYDKEFVLYITLNGINIEKIWRDDTYYSGSADITFVHEDCSSKLLKYIDSRTIYEFGYDEDECDCDECEYCDENSEDEGYTVNGKPATKEEFDGYVSQFKKSDDTDKKEDSKELSSSTSKAVYRVNGKEVDKETFDFAMSKIEDRYLDNVRDMLLGYCDVMDRMNQWRSRLFW